MRGARVVVLSPVEVGTDSHGNVIYDETRETVDNVLIRPNIGDTNSNPSAEPYATETSATFAFPKTFTASLRGCRIYVPDYDRIFRAVDDPLPTLHNCPTKWNRLVKGVLEDGQ